MISIVFFGTPEFAIPSLKALLDDSEFDVKAVVTQPDRPAGRGQKMSASPIKIFAESRGCTVLQPPRLSDKNISELLTKLRPDMFVVAAYGELIPDELLALPKYGCVNIHPSLLPKYRGATPIPEALLHGDLETGVTFMKMSNELDAGDILFLERLLIDPADTTDTLTKKLSLLAGHLLPNILKDYYEGRLTPLPQNHAKATVCQKLTKESGRIDWKTWAVEQVKNGIRAYTPWPGCYTIWNKKTLKLLAAEIRSDEIDTVKPGEIKIFDNKQFGIRASDVFIVPLKLQLEGKSPTTAEAFLHGYEKHLREVPFCS